MAGDGHQQALRFHEPLAVALEDRPHPPAHPVAVVRLAELAGNTLLVGALASAVTVAVALIALYGVRRDRGRVSQAGVRVAQLGYATPGVVVAIGILMTLSLFLG